MDYITKNKQRGVNSYPQVLKLIYGGSNEFSAFNYHRF